jgi:hypothetical protein
MLTEHFAVAPRPILQPALDPSIYRHELHSQQDLAKRRFELAMQFGLVLIFLIGMAVALHEMLKLFLNLRHILWGPNESQYPQGPLPTWKMGEEENPEELRWLERREVTRKYTRK